MDNKEIKAGLKQARAAFKEKDFETVLKVCKAIVEVDENNYNAWTLIGAATRGTDEVECLHALKRATDISPSEILAWQGLCSLYEKQGQAKNQEDLLRVYETLHDLLNSDKEKQQEILEKRIKILKSMGNIEKLMEIFQMQLKVVTDDLNGHFNIWKSILEELKNQKSLSPSLDELRRRACKEIIHHENLSEVDCQDILTYYIEPLYKSGCYEKAIQLALDLICKFSLNIPSVEFLIKANLDAYIRTREIYPSTVAVLANWVNKLQSGLDNVYQGVNYLISGKFIQAIQDLDEGLRKCPSNLEAWCIKTEVQLKLHKYADSEKSAKLALCLAKKLDALPQIFGQLYLYLGESFFGRRSWHSALEAVQKSVEFMEQTLETMSLFCRILLSIDQIAKAEKICDEIFLKFPNSPQGFQLRGYKHLKQKQFKEALQNFKLALEFKESSFILHLIAVVLWEMEQVEKAKELFLQAAKLDPYFSENFLYLGKYYMNYKDFRKALECFQRSYKLDTSNAEVAKCLSLALQKSGRNEEHLEFLKIISREVYFGCCKWVWVELGLNQLDNNDYSDAVLSLQNAVRLDPKDSYIWECLGDAYLKRGSHESALKAYEKASELSPKALYPMFQISTIQKMRGLYISAVEKYKNVLNIQDSYVPALIGLAEALLNLAKESFKECIFGQVRHCCQEALEVLSRVINTTTGLSSLWKLAGDACTLPFYLSEKWFPIVVPSALCLDSDGKDLICLKKELLCVGAKFYGTGITVHRNLSSLWHDLGINIHLQSLMDDSKETTVELANKALLCLQKAVSVSPNQCAHWTALGVISSSKGLCDCEFAQHAYIKSIEIERNNSEAWTNLGILYLVCGNVELAHKTFGTAQSLEPTYPLCWLGQAVIASTVKHNETVDLFRHAATLGPHSESLLGYGRMVCKLLLDTAIKNTDLYKYNIEEMDAIVVATDCLLKYIDNNPNSPEALNMLGMLLERQGVLNAALNAYRRSRELLQESGSLDDFPKACFNYARLLSCNGHYKMAEEQYMMIKKVDITLLCTFGFSLQKAQQYDKALKVFNQALQFSQNLEEKSHILVAKAMVAFNMTGKDAPNPFNVLLESSQMKPPSVHGLFALCALGILRGETKLAFASLKELKASKRDPLYYTSVAFLEASYYYFVKDEKSALRTMLKVLHCHPNNSSLWIQLASCLLQWNTNNAHISSTCGRIALCNNGNKESCSQILALCHLATGCRQIALAAAQKAVHLHPDKLNNWVTLTAACHVASKQRENIGWIFSFVKGLAKKQKISSDVLNWLFVMECFHFIHTRSMASVDQFASKGLNVIENPKMKSILLILIAVSKVLSGNETLDHLVVAVKKSCDVFLGWEVLLQLLVQTGRFSDAEKTIEEFKAASKLHFTEWTSFPVVQLAVLSWNAFFNSNENKEYWMNAATKYAGDAVRMSPDCFSAQFIRGLIAFKAPNMSLSQKSFDRAVSLCNTTEKRSMEGLSRQLLSYFRKCHTGSKHVSFKK